LGKEEMNMKKTDVQKRVLQNGKPLALSKFSWCEKTKTFASTENNLVIDFAGINGCTFKTGWDCTFDTGEDCTFDTGSGCTFKTGSGCTFDTGSGCTFNTGSGCTFNTGGGCTFDTGEGCTFDTGSDCTFKTGSGCTFDTGSGCTFKTGSGCTFDTGGGCTFDTGSGCTFKTGWDCTFKTGEGCTFDTGSDCTFKTGSDCTFNTGGGCTFNTGWDCVIVNRNVFEVIRPKEGDVIQICPRGIAGHLLNGMYNGKPHIIADGILSEIVHKRGDVYTVINHGETVKSYLVTDGKNWAHGDTVKSATEDLLFKSADGVDVEQYRGLSLDTVKTPTEWAVIYRAITKACVTGMRNFMAQRELKETYTLAEVIAETRGAYNSELFEQFFGEQQ